jgi:serine/threonine protein kinase
MELKERKTKLSTFEQILDGVEYLHVKGIIHRDLKPENIHFKRNVAKISDFSLAKEGVLSTLYPHTVGIGTPIYCAPEQESGRLYNKKSDVFSLGIIWAEIWLNETMENDRQRFWSWVENIPLVFPDQQTGQQTIPSEIKKMISDMTQQNPNNRFDIRQTKETLINLKESLNL